MRYFMVSFFCKLARVLLSLRYKIKVEGKEYLKKSNFKKDSGILFLPNHPAHVDPILISTFLWPKFQVRPVVVEYVYRQPVIRSVMKAIRAFAIPTFETSMNELKRHNAENVVNNMIKGIKKGDNFLIYPAGRLKHTGKEILGGASACHQVLKKNPDTQIVLIRTTGLWGSSFSRAYLGRSPDFKSTAISGLKNLFKNFIFFMPRRKITIQISLAPKDFPKNASRLELNRYLENWYNKYPTKDGIKLSEPLNQVSYSIFKKKFLQPADIKRKQELTAQSFSSETEEKIFGFIAKLCEKDITSIRSDMNLSFDLGLDSLDVSELITYLTVEYDVGEVHPEDVDTVQDILEIAEGKRKKQSKPKEKSTFTWPEEKFRKEPHLPMGKTVQESFLRSCDDMKEALACADDLLGSLTYKKLKLSALVLSDKIKQMPGKYIAVLLPSSVASYMIILAILLAGKIPVMLNWTLGPRYLNNMMRKTGAQVVISSWKFLEKLTNVEFGHLTKKIRYLEDIKQSISKKEKVVGLLRSFKKAKSLLKTLQLDKISEDEPAVILFTSGSEANPKAVPLSHKNIISNQRAAMQCVVFEASEIMLGMLPPFHSFGFSIVGLLPLLAGIRVVYSPDPTDSYTLADVIQRWKVTIMCNAPSFLRSVLNVVTDDQLKTIRMFVTAAEKTPKELFEQVERLEGNKNLIEGYGITECSPAVSLNRFNRANVGVGQLLPGFEACMIDPESDEVLDRHREGEICLKGEGVFLGYMHEEKDPFITINNEKWYRTGDLGYFDKDENLILSGRLKRFTKIGGEMISLGGVEEIINHELKLRGVLKEDKPSIAVCADEKDNGKTNLVLFSTIALDKSDINHVLKGAGFSRIVKISFVKKINEIPLMGTGKTDYRFLQTLIG
jgi:acyl carrier protein